ncbi:MAG: hypothetical protein ABI639_13850 [Thermoanaerobaculia bacterium]
MARAPLTWQHRSAGIRIPGQLARELLEILKVFRGPRLRGFAAAEISLAPFGTALEQFANKDVRPVRRTEEEEAESEAHLGENSRAAADLNGMIHTDSRTQLAAHALRTRTPRFDRLR